ncbi:hypothetical protein C8F01DRAFT_1099740 [Mycena amicta]|nr:hypothetical protein C8F01DRAFT_1099740 [Mycena amicta]
MSSLPTLESLTAQLSLSTPVPNPVSHPDLLTTNDVQREEDLMRNMTSFRAWWSAIHTMRDAYTTQQREESSDLPTEIAALMGPLATPLSRLSFQRLIFIYETALSQFPNSFKLWKSYLSMRMSFVCGRLVVKKRAGGKKKLPEMKDALEDEKEDLEEWEGGLDPIVGWEEWKSLVAAFERALMWLPKRYSLPRLWLMYLSIFSHRLCPSILSNTHARHTYDLWCRYLLWGESKGGATTVALYRRYLAVDPSITERFTALLLSPSNSEPRPLEAAKLLLSLARKAATGQYTSPEGKSPYQLLCDWLDVVEKFADEVGLDMPEAAPEEEPAETSVPGKLVRFAGAPFPATDKTPRPYDEDEDPKSSRKFNVERIIHKDGLAIYKDQAGRLWTGMATYWIKRGEFDRAKEIFEQGIASVLAIRDFTQIFDSYAEFGESLINAMMQGLEDEEDDEDAAEMQKDLDVRMADFEDLMDRRPFLVNDVLIRRNPNDVQEWEKRVALWGEDDDKVADTYTKALETINPRRATANLHRLYVNFAKFYEEGGTAAKAEADLDSARKILEKATKVNFKAVEDLAEVWCEWSEMEIRNENYDDAIRVMQRATAIPKNTKINYHDHALSAQARLFKSLKLWSFYIDLEESIGTVDTAKGIYDKILELRIANAQIIVNYAAFLEENNYFEESFKVYERGVELFTFPVSFEIWNIYLSKFIKRFGGSKLERARDLFEQALEKCPAKSCKPIFLLYSKMEEEFGLAKRALSILERATQLVADEDKFEMYTIYIAKATENFGLPATRPIYERALEVLPNRQTAEIENSAKSTARRAIYAHASQFCDPRVYPQFWAEWNTFEIETGSEDTFREMLRIKRSVQAQFNTEASYLAAQTIAAKQGAKAVHEQEAADSMDAMAAAERASGGMAFVAATQTALPKPDGEAAAADVPVTNADEIHISDDEDI